MTFKARYYLFNICIYMYLKIHAIRENQINNIQMTIIITINKEQTLLLIIIYYNILLKQRHEREMRKHPKTVKIKTMLFFLVLLQLYRSYLRPRKSPLPSGALRSLKKKTRQISQRNHGQHISEHCAHHRGSSAVSLSLDWPMSESGGLQNVSSM